MSTASQWLLLLRVHARMAGVKATHSVKNARLMTATILLFLLAYTLSAYWLFSEGLAYVARLPGAGALLSLGAKHRVCGGHCPTSRHSAQCAADTRETADGTAGG